MNNFVEGGLCEGMLGELCGGFCKVNLLSGPLAVGRPTAGKEAVDYRGLYRVFVSALVCKGFQTLKHHYRAMEPPKQFRMRRSSAWMRD